MRTIEVCFTPELIHQHDLQGKIVVVVDVFRATSCIVTGLAHGVRCLRPVAEVDAARALGEQGYVMAGERGGQKIAGFDLGNSPLEYQNEALKGKRVAITTTNGSQAILKSQGASHLLIGAFLNLEALTALLLQLPQNIVIHCAGWKGMPNLEDTLFAGALIDETMEEVTPVGDTAAMAHQLYVAVHDDVAGAALNASHAKRLTSFGMAKDLEFCMEESKFQIVPRLVGEELIYPDSAP